MKSIIICLSIVALVTFNTGWTATNGCYVSVVNTAQSTEEVDDQGKAYDAHKIVREVYVPDCSCGKTLFEICDVLTDVLRDTFDTDIVVVYSPE